MLTIPQNRNLYRPAIPISEARKLQKNRTHHPEAPTPTHVITKNVEQDSGMIQNV